MKSVFTAHEIAEIRENSVRGKIASPKEVSLAIKNGAFYESEGYSANMYNYLRITMKRN